MQIAKFVKKLAQLIANTMQDEPIKKIEQYTKHQLDQMKESENLKTYMDTMNISPNDLGEYTQQTKTIYCQNCGHEEEIEIQFGDKHAEIIG